MAAGRLAFVFALSFPIMAYAQEGAVRAWNDPAPGTQAFLGDDGGDEDKVAAGRPAAAGQARWPCSRERPHRGAGRAACPVAGISA